MSSILDALERAEKERNQSDKRTFLDSEETSPGLLQRRGLWVFGGALLLINLLVWVWVVSFDDSDQAEVALSNKQTQKQEQLATTSTLVSALEQTKTTRSAVSAPPLAVEARVPKRAVTTPTPLPVQASRKPTPLSEAKKLVDAGEDKPSPAIPEPKSEPVDIQTESLDVAEPVVAELAAAVAKEDIPEQPKEQVETAQPKLASAKAEEEKIPQFWELPAKLQKKLSDLKINIHVFNEEPSQRFVIINMRRYKEGDRLETYGMQLERITREGIVINHGDGLVRM